MNPEKIKNLKNNEEKESDSVIVDRLCDHMLQQSLNEKRYKEIDKALVEKNKERFLALTSSGWESIL